MLAGKSGVSTSASILQQQVSVAATFQASDSVWRTMDDKESRETIHSGHFMISNVPQDEDEGEERSVVEEQGGMPVAVQITVMTPQQNASNFRMRSSSDPTRCGDTAGSLNIRTKAKVIDSSLSKLFECMTLAYRQKLTSPKWNNFKGLKLRWTIKIRLNNIIWRAWHMQFVKQVRPLIAPFAIEVDPSPHAKAEAVVMEGKYWKRRLSIVSAEYRRWRVWYKDRVRGVIPQETPLSGVNIDVGRLERQIDPANSGNLAWLQQQIMEEPTIIMDDLNFSPDFTDVLFSRIANQPFPYQNSREMAMSANADFIQPGLLQLQPSLEELMDTLEPLQDFFNSQGFTPSSGYGSQYSNFGLGNDTTSGGMVNNDMYSMQENDYWRTSVPVSQDMSLNHSQLDKYSAPSNSNLPRKRFEQQFPPSTIQSTGYQPNHSSDYISLQSMMPCSNQQFSGGQYTQQQQADDEESRKDHRQRSMSGPILGGQTVVESGVLNALINNYNRSASVSNGNLVPEQGSMDQMNQKQNPLRIRPDAAASNFAVPQASRGRKPKNTKQLEEATPHIVKQSVTKKSPGQVAIHHLESSSTLEELLKSQPAVAKGSFQHDLLGSSASNVFLQSAKKIAPKPPLVAHVEVKPRISNNSFVAMSVESVSEPQRNTFAYGAETCVKSDPFELHLSSGSTEGSFKLNSEPTKTRCTESRRMSHITAEQKRRGHIKSGFEVLHGLVPSLAQNASVKVSKAVVLHKGAEYIHQLKDERRLMQAEVEDLKQQIETINQAVVACQQQLPATGAPVNSRARNDHMNDMLEEYIRTRTLQNWKFWLFSHIMRSLFDGYATHVSTRSMEELSQSVMTWLDQQCTLVQLRPLIKEAMRKLSTTTHVLSDPARLPEEARQAVQKNAPPSSSSSSGAKSFS